MPAKPLPHLSVNKTKKPWATVRANSAIDYAYVFTSLLWVKYVFRLFLRFVYPLGKLMILHLPADAGSCDLLCQRFAVAYYSFTLGRLGSAASSTFAQLRCYFFSFCRACSAAMAMGSRLGSEEQSG